MNIAFIKPPQTYLLDPERNAPLGLMYVAAVAANGGHEVKILDLSAKKETEDFLSLIPKADIYAFTVSILDYKFSHKLARQLKERSRCLVVFGGVFPTTAVEQIDFNIVDSVVIGEGEKSFRKLLDDIANGGGPAKRYISPRIKNLDSIYFPIRDGVKIASYRLVEEGIPAATIIASRGCPFSCVFCASKTMWGGEVYFRSAENVLEEIDLLIKDYSIRGLKFLDDTLTLRLDFFRKLCRGLKERNIIWRCSTRADLITEELAKIMHESGCAEAGIGVESADPNILKLMNKGIAVEKNERAIKIIKDAGINAACFFMTGLPGETEETPELNISFLKRTDPDRVFCATFMPYPGTSIWEEPHKFGIKIISRDLSKYNQVSGIGEGDREFVAIPNALTYEQLQKNREKMVNFMHTHSKYKFNTAG